MAMCDALWFALIHLVKYFFSLHYGSSAGDRNWRHNGQFRKIPILIDYIPSQGRKINREF